MMTAAIARFAVTTRRACRDSAITAGMAAGWRPGRGHDDDVGGVEGHRGAGAGGGQRGRVVDAVPGHQDIAAAGFQIPHRMHLVLRCWLKPDQELTVAEVADQGAAFASAPAEGGVAGPRAARSAGSAAPDVPRPTGGPGG